MHHECRQRAGGATCGGVFCNAEVLGEHARICALGGRSEDEEARGLATRLKQTPQRYGVDCGAIDGFFILEHDVDVGIAGGHQAAGHAGIEVTLFEAECGCAPRC